MSDRPQRPPAGRLFSEAATEGPPRPAPRRRLLVVAIGGALPSLAAWASALPRRPPAPSATNAESHEETAPRKRFPLTPISTSPFENTAASAKYVGSQACVACHEEEHESFRDTGMGRSMSPVDLEREPA